MTSFNFPETTFHTQGSIYSLIARFMDFIFDPQSFSLFHQHLNPAHQKRYVQLLPQIIAHLKYSKLLLPTILSHALSASSPHDLFNHDDVASQILAQWVSQNINFNFLRSLKSLLSSLKLRTRLHNLSKPTHLSKLLRFLCDYPQPDPFWHFFAALRAAINARFPGYESLLLAKFFFLRYLAPLIRAIGEEMHCSFAGIEVALTTLVLSLQAPRCMLPRHFGRDDMNRFLSQLKGARAAVGKVPQFMAFVAMAQQDYLDFFELVPKMGGDLHLRLREHQKLEGKWIFLMLEWSTQLDKLAEMPSPRKYMLLFRAKESETEQETDGEEEEKMKKKEVEEKEEEEEEEKEEARVAVVDARIGEWEWDDTPRDLAKRKKFLHATSSSNSSFITDHSYTDELSLEDIDDNR